MPQTEPRIVIRTPQTYAALRLSVAQEAIPQRAPPLVPKLLEWVEAHAEQVGAVFFNYVKMGTEIDMEIGVPIADAVAESDGVVIGTLPGGRYASSTWIGPYDQLRQAHDALHGWVAAQGLPAMPLAEGGAVVLEIYHTDPDEIPDPANWITELAFRLES